jgi:hypothetical protein
MCVELSVQFQFLNTCNALCKLPSGAAVVSGEWFLSGKDLGVL